MLTVAGSDSSGGAGVQADLKTFAAHGVHGVCAVTAIVAEAPGAVGAIHPMSGNFVSAQLQRVASAFSLDAIKTGMLATTGAVEAVIDFVKTRPGLPLVVDPVFRAGAGAALLSEEGIGRLRNGLLPLATLVTPNLSEAERLLGRPLRSAAEFAAAPRHLFEQYGCPVLLKGGHFFRDGTTVSDHAWIQDQARIWTRRRLEVPDVHGTGCTLSAAIAAGLARDPDPLAAIGGAIRYLEAALEQHHRWTGPEGEIEALNHFPDGLDWSRS